MMSMNTLDFFPVATADAFAELMRAKASGGDAVKAFKHKNKDLQRFKKHMAAKPNKLTPYEASRFNSINSFYLVDDHQKQTAVRWAFTPSQSQNIVLEPTENFFFDNFKANLKNKEVAWDMVITLANKDDNVNNPAIEWKGKHDQVTAAKLVIDSISSELDGQCDSVNFDPLILSSGFSPSADILLQARRHAYALSFAKRLSEKFKE